MVILQSTNHSTETLATFFSRNFHTNDTKKSHRNLSKTFQYTGEKKIPTTGIIHKWKESISQNQIKGF